VKIRFVFARDDGVCPVCERPYRQGEKMVRLNGRERVHGRCAEARIRKARNHLAGVLGRVTREFGLKRKAKAPPPAWSGRVVGYSKGQPVFLKEDGRTARAKRNPQLKEVR